jgi:uncharacterized protein (DUF58 family)
MPLRRRAWLSREGWYYLAVLTFIVAGAILKNVNLLVALAGMMIAPLVINWRMVMASLSGLKVRRNLPEQVCAGEPLTVEIVAENPRRWMSSWLLTVEDWIERVGDELDSRLPAPAAGRPSGQGAARETAAWWNLRAQGLRLLVWLRLVRLGATRASAVIRHVPACGQAIGTYRLTLHRRGRYRFGPLRVSTRFPLGLVSGQITQPVPGELIVAPRLGRLSPEWLQLIEAELVGDQRRHPHRGVSEGDYYGLRPWQGGDSMRWVHWRTTAKLGRPIVRQFERRRNRDVALLIDPWLPENFREEDEGYLELAVSLAATAIADLTNRGHSRLTFVVAGREPACYSGPASLLLCQELLARLADVMPARDCRLAAALDKLITEAPFGARLVIISPRPASAFGQGGETIDLAADPENFCWIDASSEQLPSLFQLE